MPAKRRSWAEPLISIGLTGLGIILALAPVAFWVAWTPFVFLVVLAVIGVSAALFIVLYGCQLPATEDQRATPGNSSRAVLPDEFVEEIHRIFPLTYHHSLHGRARFRRAMEKLRRLTD